jgi:hypothetical protein
MTCSEVDHELVTYIVSDKFCWLKPGSNTKALFVPASHLAFPAEKLRSQKQEQTINFSTDFWNAEKQAFEEMN